MFPTFQVCVVSASLVQLFVTDNPGLSRNLHNILCFFNPLYPLMGCLNCITKVRAQAGDHTLLEMRTFLSFMILLSEIL